ncbi:MAG: acyl carrier protein [Acidimicrobiia bacterium]
MNIDEASDVIAGILGQIAPEIDLTSVPRDAELQQELDLDSMDFLNLVSGILEATGIEVPEHDYPQLQSLDGCASYLVQHSGDRHPAT